MLPYRPASCVVVVEVVVVVVIAVVVVVVVAVAAVDKYQLLLLSLFTGSAVEIFGPRHLKSLHIFIRLNISDYM